MDAVIDVEASAVGGSGRHARLAWGLLAATLILSLGGLVFLVTSWSTPPPPGAFGFRGFVILLAVAFGPVGAIIATRLPRNPVGWIALSVGVLAGLQGLANEYAIWALIAHGSRTWLAEFAGWFPAWIWVPATSGAGLILLLFPDGRPLTARWRPVVWTLTAGVVLAAIGFAISPGPLQNFSVLDNPFGFGGKGVSYAIVGTGMVLYGASMAASGVAVAVRFRRSRGDERQQMKWLVAAAAFFVLTLSLSIVPTLSSLPGADGASSVPFTVALGVILGFSALPTAIGFGILKYRLYDIDLVISKAVVYGSLAVAITVIYLLIVVGIGAVAGSGGNAFLSAVAAGVVALGFQPLRGRAQRLADRVVYGKRATPYEVLSDFSERLGDAYSVDQVLPRLARVLAEGIGADRVTVWLGHGPLRAVAAWPESDVMDRADRIADLAGSAFEVRHQGEVLGAITVVMPPSEPLSGAHEKLIGNVAAQAGLVMRNVALVDDLQESRRRIVAAGDERARTLERNIHDGAQQQLVALKVHLALLEQQVDRDPAAAKATAVRLQSDVAAAIDDLRDLARGIYPPLLADRGLGAALEAQAAKTPLPVTVVAEGIDRFGQDVEAAVYFCVLEALQNVTKYAQATRAEVRVAVDPGHLTFEVADDGAGFDPGTNRLGSGLQGMADRLAALGGTLDVRSTPGGGTTVSGRLPV